MSLRKASRLIPQVSRHGRRSLMTASKTSSTASQRVEGDISSVFVSLSGAKPPPLPRRFLDLKRSLVAGREDQVIRSWTRLLERLQTETELIASRGSAVIPQVEFNNLEGELERLRPEIALRGAAVIKGVIPEQEARAYKHQVEDYVRANPTTKAFPAHDPQVFELYWSKAQVAARAHPKLLQTQSALMKHLWHTSDPDAPISTSQPITYADRVRIRQPGDKSFALGPHQDGGSVERWEPEGYGKGAGVYSDVFAGQWEKYSPWDAARRVDIETDLYHGPGNCSMFRMFQGWLGISHTGPGKGTLLVNPLLQLSTAYVLLRPFFRPLRESSEVGKTKFLDGTNWAFTGGNDMTSALQGATPGHGQELSDELHPHLRLDQTMVHMPDIKPGDFVVWHCDTIHAVDKIHNGMTDSSVMYIPVCPLTEINARYLVTQRESFLAGTPGPDFPGGKGESEHVGRATTEYLATAGGQAALRAMGFARLLSDDGDMEGAKKVTDRANEIMGF